MSIANAEIVDCLIIKDDSKILVQEGQNCDTRYSPASTFKIPLSLMGYESGILKDENYPVWKSSEEVVYVKDYWSGEKSPSSWMRYSIVWYSQILTQKLGMKKFQIYLNKLNYGNKDLSGENALTQAWLSNSLAISPAEQIDFIYKLAKNELPFSLESQIKTKNLIRLFEESFMSDGWSIYGKTGTSIDEKRGGYFIGFAEKNHEIITFVVHITGEKNSKIGGIFAKKLMLEKLSNGIINQ